MTIPYRILKTSGELRIECNDQIFAEDELCEEIWLNTMEIKAGLPRSEQLQATRQIAHLEKLLAALRSAGA